MATPAAASVSQELNHDDSLTSANQWHQHYRPNRHRSTSSWHRSTAHAVETVHQQPTSRWSVGRRRFVHGCLPSRRLRWNVPIDHYEHGVIAVQGSGHRQFHQSRCGAYRAAGGGRISSGFQYHSCGWEQFAEFLPVSGTTVGFVVQTRSSRLFRLSLSEL